jgi:hypothetical protein
MKAGLAPQRDPFDRINPGYRLPGRESSRIRKVFRPFGHPVALVPMIVPWKSCFPK